MTNPRTYLVLGAGKQGVAAAYDLLRFGEGSVLLADAAKTSTQAALKRLRSLLPEAAGKVSVAPLNARSAASLKKLLKGKSAILSALPYYLNPGAAAAAVAAGVPYADLGGHFETTQKLQRLDGKARRAKVALVPDCGISPGTCNVLAAAGIARLDRAEEVHIYCGGLPQVPRPPLDYKLVFNLEGVIGNYLGKAYVLRDGEIALDEPLARRQTMDIPGVGRLEAAVTGGATATAPWTWRGKLRAYDYKTLRYPGHWDKIEALRGLGLLEEAPVRVEGRAVSPRKLFVACAEPRLRFPDDRDLLVLRVIVTGVKGASPSAGGEAKGASPSAGGEAKGAGPSAGGEAKDGRPARVLFDLLDHFDGATGFSAMQRTTGFSAAVVLSLLARGRVAGAGVLPIETAVPHDEYLAELRRRGLDVREELSIAQEAPRV